MILSHLGWVPFIGISSNAAFSAIPTSHEPNPYGIKENHLYNTKKRFRAFNNGR